MKPNYVTLAFQGWKIRGLEQNGIVKWVSLRDICALLNKTFHVRYGEETASLCPSRQKMYADECTRRSWVIAPSDIPPLCLHLVEDTENYPPEIKDLIKWSEEIGIKKTINAPCTLIAENEVVKEYTYNKTHTITFRFKNGTVLINATQMAKAFGKQPTIWLRLSSTNHLREKLVQHGESHSFYEQIITNRGSHGGTWMEKALALEYARWLCDEFYEWCYEKAFEITSSSIVPYHATPQPEQKSTAVSFPIPKNYEEALLLAAKQARELRENEYKVSYYNSLVEERDYFSTTRIADELQVPPCQINSFLHKMGIVYYYPSKKEWRTTDEYDRLQCDVPYYWTNKYGKSYRFGSHRRWSRTGREFIIELWNQHHKQ